MADFIESLDPQELPPPFRFPGVSMTAVAVDLGLEHGLPGLTDWCDTYLAVDPDVHYRPLSPIGYLCVLDYPRMYCDARGYEKWGYVPQKEVFFTFPMLRLGRAVGNIYLPTELTWAIPFIAVNNPTSAITGRTVLGYQKLYGDITIKTGADGSCDATVCLPTFLTLGRDIPQQHEPILSIRTGPPNPAAVAIGKHFPWSWLGHEKAADYLENTSLALLEDIIPGLLEVVNLKQMRGAQEPAKAVYQGLVQTRMQFHNPTAPTFYESPEFRIYPNASMDCGINGGQLANLAGGYRPALAAFSFQADMVLNNVKDVYIAPPVPGTPTGGIIGDWLGFWAPYWDNVRRWFDPRP